jgi:hypothetical protein
MGRKHWLPGLRVAAGNRRAAKTASLAVALLSTLLSVPTGCGFGEGHEQGRGGWACTQTTMCSATAHWDSYRCECVFGQNTDGGSLYADGGCVQTVLCTQWAHWDPTRCQCVVNPPDAAGDGRSDSAEAGRIDAPEAGPRDAERTDSADGAPTDAGACCPVTWSMYQCQFPDGGTGLACHNPAMGCASSLTCGQGCDPVVSGRCPLLDAS